MNLAVFQSSILKKFQTELQSVPGIADALNLLAHPKCVASSSNLERIQASLRLTALEPFFQSKLYSTGTVARGKPRPDVLLHAAQDIGVDPSAAIVVEDSPAGLQAAQAANTKTFAYVGGSYAVHADLKETLRTLSTDVLIDDMADPPAAVDRLAVA